MKKIFYIALAILILLFGYYLFFVPVKINKQIQVPFSMYKSGEQLNSLQQITKWNIPFSTMDTTGINVDKKNYSITSGDYHLLLSDITPYSSSFKTKYKNKEQLFSWKALLDSANGNTSIIHLTYTSTPFRKWFQKNKLEEDAEKSLDNLKDYMSESKRFYGFEIEKTTVEDTTLLFTRQTCAINERQAVTKTMFEKLINYAAAKNAGYNGTRLYYTVVNGNEITIFASIGISNVLETSENEEVQFKRMPFGKNLLVTNYQGPFMDTKKVYRALEAFKTDHNLLSMAIPYAKIMSDGYDFEDNQVVQLKIYYPVF